MNTGLEKYKVINSLYCKGLSASIIVIDKSSHESFGSCENLIKKAKYYSNNKTVFMLLANKSDLEPVVTTEQLIEIASRYSAIYL